MDYMLIPYDTPDWFTAFEIIRASNLFSEAGCGGVIDPLTANIPDHSWLKCIIQTSRCDRETTGAEVASDEESQYCKINNHKESPQDFMQV